MMTGRQERFRLKTACETLYAQVLKAVDNQNQGKSTDDILTVCTRLLEEGASPTSNLREDPVYPYPQAISPLHHAAKAGLFEFCEALLRRPASESGNALAAKDANAVTIKSELPIHFSAMFGHTDVCNLLLLKGSKVDELDSLGLSPLLLACQNLHVEAAKALIRGGANVNFAGGALEKEMTPLAWAAEVGSVELCYELVIKGAHLRPIDMDGFTPLDRARALERKEVITFLENAEQGNIVKPVVISPVKKVKKENIAGEGGGSSVVKEEPCEGDSGGSYVKQEQDEAASDTPNKVKKESTEAGASATKSRKRRLEEEQVPDIDFQKMADVAKRCRKRPDEATLRDAADIAMRIAEQARAELVARGFDDGSFLAAEPEPEKDPIRIENIVADGAPPILDMSDLDVHVVDNAYRMDVDGASSSAHTHTLESNMQDTHNVHIGAIDAHRRELESTSCASSPGFEIVGLGVESGASPLSENEIETDDIDEMIDVVSMPSAFGYDVENMQGTPDDVSTHVDRQDMNIASTPLQVNSEIGVGEESVVDESKNVEAAPCHGSSSEHIASASHSDIERLPDNLYGVCSGTTRPCLREPLHDKLRKNGYIMVNWMHPSLMPPIAEAFREVVVEDNMKEKFVLPWEKLDDAGLRKQLSLENCRAEATLTRDHIGSLDAVQKLLDAEAVKAETAGAFGALWETIATQVSKVTGLNLAPDEFQTVTALITKPGCQKGLNLHTDVDVLKIPSSAGVLAMMIALEPFKFRFCVEHGEDGLFEIGHKDEESIKAHTHDVIVPAGSALIWDTSVTHDGTKYDISFVPEKDRPHYRALRIYATNDIIPKVGKDSHVNDFYFPYLRDVLQREHPAHVRQQDIQKFLAEEVCKLQSVEASRKLPSRSSRVRK